MMRINQFRQSHYKTRTLKPRLWRLLALAQKGHHHLLLSISEHKLLQSKPRKIHRRATPNQWILAVRLESLWSNRSHLLPTVCLLPQASNLRLRLRSPLRRHLYRLLNRCQMTLLKEWQRLDQDKSQKIIMHLRNALKLIKSMLQQFLRRILSQQRVKSLLKKLGLKNRLSMQKNRRMSKLIDLQKR